RTCKERLLLCPGCSSRCRYDSDHKLHGWHGACRLQQHGCTRLLLERRRGRDVCSWRFWCDPGWYRWLRPARLPAAAVKQVSLSPLEDRIQVRCSLFFMTQMTFAMCTGTSFPMVDDLIAISLIERSESPFRARYNHVDGQRRLSLVGEPDRASPGPRRALPVDPRHCRFRPRSGSQ